MQVQAPYDYIRDYYEQARQRMKRDPEVASFWLSGLQHVKGRSVLNAGCGPMLYDNLLHIAEPPREYVGLDINRNTFEFLRHSKNPDLLRAKAKAEALGSRIEYLCADVFDCEDKLKGRFDSVMGIGFFATFSGERFDRLMRIMHRSIKRNGQLLKITWHGPLRTPEETRDKLRFRYDNPEEPTPHELVSAIERAGFSVEQNSLLKCDADTARWDAIQVCLFRRNDTDAATKLAVEKCGD